MREIRVIHVQLFITKLRDGNPVPMLQNLIKMLSTFPNPSSKGPFPFL